MLQHGRQILGGLARDVFRQFEQHGAGAFFLGDAEGVAYYCRDRMRADDLARHLGQRREARHHVHDLEPGLAGGHDSLLASEDDHRHCAEMRVGGGRGEVERAWPERRDADARLAGQPSVGCGHEAGGLLVPRDDQLDAGLAKRFNDVEIFLAGDAEDAVDTFVLQRGDEKIGTLGHETPHIAPACR